MRISDWSSDVCSSDLLKHPDGKAVLRRLIPAVDALVSNIRPAGLARLGLGYEQCLELNPKIVYATATGFGQDGPWRARPAFDAIVQAASGFASAMGPDEETAFVPSLIADKLFGLALDGAGHAATEPPRPPGDRPKVR